MNVLDKLNEQWNNAQEQQKVKKNVTFSFLIEIEKIEALRSFESFKRKTDFHYSVSDVIREGIEIMRNQNKNLPSRPNGLIPTRRGKHSNSQKKERVFTSYRISENDRDFIYDYMYNKCSKMEGNYTKDDFMEDLIEAFKSAYK